MSKSKHICWHSAEIYINGVPASPGLGCSRTAGHDGECSQEVKGFTTHENKRVETTLKVHWPSPKMLRKKFGVKR